MDFIHHLPVCLIAAGGAFFSYKTIEHISERKAETKHPEFVTITYDNLLEFTTQCLTNAGSTPENSRIVAQVLVEADLRGITSHGVNRLELYCDEVRRGVVSTTNTPSIINETSAMAMVDGQNCQGAVVGTYCMNLAMEKAKSSGIGWVVARHSNHYGIAGYYPMQAAKKGFFGMCFTNTSPCVYPTRAKKACIGTNPIAVAAPTHSEPVVLDMATPTVPHGKVEVHYRTGKKVPLGWGVDSNGDPTTDPAKIIFGGGLSPLGGSEETRGYKGYGLGLMVEMMCGIMGNSAFGKNIGQACNPNAIHRMEPVNLGQCFIAVDTSKFAPGYADRMQSIVDDLHDLPVAANAIGPVLVPGEKEHIRASHYRKEGIPIPYQVFKAIEKVGETFAVSTEGILENN